MFKISALVSINVLGDFCQFGVDNNRLGKQRIFGVAGDVGDDCQRILGTDAGAIASCQVFGRVSRTVAIALGTDGADARLSSAPVGIKVERSSPHTIRSIRSPKSVDRWSSCTATKFGHCHWHIFLFITQVATYHLYTGSNWQKLASTMGPKGSLGAT